MKRVLFASFILGALLAFSSCGKSNPDIPKAIEEMIQQSLEQPDCCDFIYINRVLRYQYDGQEVYLVLSSGGIAGWEYHEIYNAMGAKLGSAIYNHLHIQLENTGCYKDFLTEGVFEKQVWPTE